MIRGLSAILPALGQTFTHYTLALTTSGLTVLLSLPLLLVLAGVGSVSRSVAVVPLGMALLVGILPNPAAAGLHYAASQLAHGDGPEIRDQWRDKGRNASTAFRCWAASLPITAIIFLNLVFYAGRSGILELAWTIALVIWAAIHLYVYPLIFTQDTQGIILTYRNALVLVASRPVATLVVLPVWCGILVIVSTTGLAILGGLTLAAAIQHNLTCRLLPTLVRDRTSD